MRHHRTRESALAILKAIIKRRHPMILKIQDEMVNEKKGLEYTGAGIKVNEDLIEADRKHKEELEALRKEMKDADESSKQEIAELMQKQQAEIDENRRQRKNLEASMADLENERAKDMEDLREQLTEQSKNLKARETEITDFKKLLAAREEADTLRQGEQKKLQDKLDQMERDQAAEVKRLKAAIAQARRRTPGTYNHLKQKRLSDSLAQDSGSGRTANWIESSSSSSGS